METLKSREQLPDKVYRLTLSSDSGIIQIPLAEALEGLKSAYKNPEQALLSSSEDNPLIANRVYYWI
jgi:hypothetical protein